MFVYAFLSLLLPAWASNRGESSAAVISAEGNPDVQGSGASDPTIKQLVAKTVCQPTYSAAQCDFFGCCSWRGGSCMPRSEDAQCTNFKVWTSIASGDVACGHNWNEQECGSIGCCKFEGQCKSAVGSGACSASGKEADGSEQKLTEAAANAAITAMRIPSNDAYAVAKEAASQAARNAAGQAQLSPEKLAHVVELAMGQLGPQKTASIDPQVEELILREAQKAAQPSGIASLLQFVGFRIGAADPALAAETAWLKSKELGLSEEQAFSLATRAAAIAALDAGVAPQAQIQQASETARAFLRKHSQSRELLALLGGQAAGYAAKELGQTQDAQQKAAMAAAGEVVKDAGFSPEIAQALVLRSAAPFMQTAALKTMPDGGPSNLFATGAVQTMRAEPTAGPTATPPGTWSALFNAAPSSSTRQPTSMTVDMGHLPTADIMTNESNSSSNESAPYEPAPCAKPPPPCPPGSMASPVYDSPSGENPDIPLTQQRRPVRETGQITNYINKGKLGKFAAALMGR